MSSKLTQTNRLLNLPEYQDYLQRIEVHEKDRRLCRHNLAHFLDVARIAAVIANEEGLSLNRDLIYTTALLHDIGRFVQYENGTPTNGLLTILPLAFSDIWTFPQKISRLF